LPVHLDEQDSEGIGGPAKVVLVGQYGVIAHPKSSGVSIAWEGGQNPAKHVNERQPNTRFPAAAMPPTRAQLAEMAEQLAQAIKTAPTKSPRIIPITDDWRTEGSWLGRYGRYWGCLFACPAPDDYVWAPRSIPLDHGDAIGPHHRKGDSARYWVEWGATRQKRVLELPEVLLNQRVAFRRADWRMGRRESEIDDHGERYPATWQGPGVYVYLHIPSGIYTLSLYLFNPNGHTGAARDRDFAVSLRVLPQSYHFVVGEKLNTTPLAELKGSAHSRATDSCGGVWGRFLVRGPTKLAIQIGKNYSFNTLIQAVMLDPISQYPAPYYYGHRAWRAREKMGAEFRSLLVAACRNGKYIASVADAPRSDAALSKQILQLSDVLEHRAPTLWAANQRLAYTEVLRWCVAHSSMTPKSSTTAAIAEKCYYHLSLFHQWEAVETAKGITTSREIEQGLRWDGVNSSYRGLEFQAIRRYVRKLQIAADDIRDLASRR
jgi:hypothetical protein